MSQEKVLKTLESLGLSKPEAFVFIFLAKKGSQKGKDIARALTMPKQHLYLVLKNLQSKGIVNASLERPAKFSALPFERALDLFIKTKIEEAQRIEGDRNEILSDWQTIAISGAGDQSPKFTVLEGRKHIYSRLKQMIEDTKSQLSIISTLSGLVRADQFGLLEAAFNHASITKTKFRFLTEVSKENLKATKMLLEKMPKISSVEGRTPELDFKLISRMLIRDDAEAAFFVGQEADKTAKDTDEVCLWTNSNPIVNSFKVVFEDLWKNSTEIKSRVVEIESGKPTSKTYIINDPEASRKKYDNVMGAAKKEIFIITSSAGLVEAWKNGAELRAKTEKGVAVKIMAPIIKENLEAALKLSECCKVRHVPASYRETSIVDDEHLFQFKTTPSNQEKQNYLMSFENTFYSNESESVEKTRNLLDNVWKNAVTPSAATVEEITKPPTPSAAPVPEDEYTISRKDSGYQKMVISLEEKTGVITEEYVLNKIINAKRDPDLRRFYGSSATAVIHPTDKFILPDMLLTFYHCNKQSYWGAEDYLVAHLWLETPKGYAYVPVAVAGDNPTAMEARKVIYAGTPAIQNFSILKKDELHIQVHGNTLFAGWTVPIPLFPPKYVLPPASLLFEGYGKIKTAEITITMPSGSKSIVEGNGLDAFVTFFHAESKYAGPGTDGIFSRDFILTVYR